MSALFGWLWQLPSVVGIVVGAALATVGWLYTARRQRSLMRKQLTFNALLNVSFNKDYQEALGEVGKYAQQGLPPDINSNHHELRFKVKYLLNHYEFLAAGIRNGDIAEVLLQFSEKGTVIRLVEISEEVIKASRDTRRKSTYEHIEWLYERWRHERRPWWERSVEWCRGRPFHHRENAVHAALILPFTVLLVAVVLLVLRVT